MPVADLFAVFRWWLALTLLGVAATPIAYLALRRLPDRGYAFTKMIGLLAVSYLFWMLGSLGILGNNLGGILLCVGVVAALSLLVVRSLRGEFRYWVSGHWRYILLVEIVFALFFLFWSWARAQNPAIAATEKPMELAFLNSVGRSPAFPPLDPWLSGFAISYYYFGYVMSSLLIRLAAVPEAVGFNLTIAWLAAGASLGAFGLLYNLVQSETPRRMLGSAAVVLGLAAALALPVAGNLQVGLELLHGNGIGSADFWELLDVREINTPPATAGAGPANGAPARYEGANWWWWRSSRVIHEYHLSGRAEEGLEPIAEFPAFSFVLGDMHPHVLALPFAFLSLAVALAWWRSPTPDGWWAGGLRARAQALRARGGLPLIALTVLTLGGLSFLNTWDVLIHLFVVVGAIMLGRWRAAGRWSRDIPAHGLTAALLLAVPAVLLYLPFYLGFRSQAGPPFLLPTLVMPTRLVHFLIIFGMSLLSIVLFLGVLIVRAPRRSWRIALATAVGLPAALLLLALFLGWVAASSAAYGNAAANLAAELGLVLPARPGAGQIAAQAQWGWRALAGIAPALVGSRLTGGALILLLSALAGLIAMLWSAFVPLPPDTGAGAKSSSRAGGDVLPFALLLIFTGVLLTLGPEFVYLRDNFGQRINTIFKFYYQAWALFGVAALYGLHYLWRRARAVGWVALAGYGLLLAVAMTFPYFAINSRALEYGNAPTLNGEEQFARFNPDEYAAILWLRANAGPGDTVLEAVGGQYSAYGRVATHTGIPTLLGWPGHEYQWRGDTPEPAEREPAVRDIYVDAGWERARELLNHYGVSYIFVGSLERSNYGPDVRDRFTGRLEQVFANDGAAIFRVPAE